MHACVWSYLLITTLLQMWCKWLFLFLLRSCAVLRVP